MEKDYTYVIHLGVTVEHRSEKLENGSYAAITKTYPTTVIKINDSQYDILTQFANIEIEEGIRYFIINDKKFQVFPLRYDSK